MVKKITFVAKIIGIFFCTTIILNAIDLKILPLICYEIIFPNLIQKFDINTNLIVNISEDGWFGNSIGPDQHFAKAIFRAIENNCKQTGHGVCKY